MAYTYLYNSFSDFSEQELNKFGKNLTFVYRSSKKSVNLKSDGDQYSIEFEDFTEIIAILDNFLIRLSDHYKRMAVKNFRFKLKYDKEFVKHLTHRFLKAVEIHAKERIKLKDLEVSSK